VSFFQDQQGVLQVAPVGSAAIVELAVSVESAVH